MMSSDTKTTTVETKPETKSPPPKPVAKKPEPEIPEKVKVPDYAHLLPQSIRKFTLPQEIHDAEHLSFLQRIE